MNIENLRKKEVVLERERAELKQEYEVMINENQKKTEEEKGFRPSENFKEKVSRLKKDIDIFDKKLHSIKQNKSDLEKEIQNKYISDIKKNLEDKANKIIEILNSFDKEQKEAVQKFSEKAKINIDFQRVNIKKCKELFSCVLD